jgi:hypothetical protein
LLLGLLIPAFELGHLASLLLSEDGALVVALALAATFCLGLDLFELSATRILLCLSLRPALGASGFALRIIGAAVGAVTNLSAAFHAPIAHARGTTHTSALVSKTLRLVVVTRRRTLATFALVFCLVSSSALAPVVFRRRRSLVFLLAQPKHAH